MGSGLSRRTQLVAAVASCAVALGAAPLVAAFMQEQVPDAPSPATGAAQVVAQGVVNIDGADLRWEVSEQAAPLPANAVAVTSDPGFLIGDAGVILVEDVETGEQWRVPEGEAILTRLGAQQVRAALGSGAAVYLHLGLVGVPAEGAVEEEGVIFASEPFTGPGARHDLDLLQAELAPAQTMEIPAGALPSLVFLLNGRADVTTEAGDVISLGVGEAASVAGALVFTASENGAEVAVATVGPAVPVLGQAAATPAATGRVIEAPGATTTPVAAASPAAAVVAATATATPGAAAVVDPDDDGDGLTNSREAELNTDPALTDTDEDGLTDGQEVLETGTAPLAPDSDGDGVLDGDEVAQGTDPLDGGVAAPVVEEPAAVVEEAPVVDPAVTVGDSDGDGLEDAIELELGTDPFAIDTDLDGVSDGDEYYVHATGTRNPDTDGDGVLDGDEVNNGTDPNDPNSF
jgi:hypothetical protein